MITMTPPQMVTRVLENGLTVLLSPDDRCPVTAICVWYRVGARNEPAGQTGLAHLIEHLMFQGSAQVGPNEHTEYIQRTGGATNGDTTLESTYFVDCFPAHHLEPVLWLEADRMRSAVCTLSADRFENQREVVINERLQRYDNKPLALVWERLVRLAHPEGHPYQHVPAGRLADLRCIQQDSALEFWNRYYHPGNAVLSVVGDFDLARASEWVERYFGPIPSGSPVAADRVLPPEMPVAWERLRLGHTAAVGLMTAFRVPSRGSADAAAMTCAAAILDSGGHRGIRAALRDRQVAADIRINLIPLAKAPSLAVISLKTAPFCAPPDADLELRKELSRLADSGPTWPEVDSIKAALGLAALEKVATVEGRAVEISGGMALHGDPEFFWKFAWDVASVTPAGVKRAAGNYLGERNWATAEYVGDNTQAHRPVKDQQT
jgi:predicted Zn-dependent peptidase